ncbi:MAG: Wzz/FepE/Etk N-terminal domain-containing protein [Victivallaceae bacterium]|nr:Wzz/FepE/Etk N-terminal domain-containing protein [Victivallaceae bacterium]
MILDSENTGRSAAAVETASDGGGLAIGHFSLNILKRDHRLWVFALIARWKYIVAIPAGVALFTFIYVYAFTKPVYTSSCALVRYEVQNSSNNGMPDGYSPIQMAVILNMIMSRNNLQQTIDRLGLHMTPGQLFGCLSIKQAAKRSNYIYITAETGDPELSAKIANTQASVFVEDYKYVIRNNLVDILDTLENNRSSLISEINLAQTRRNEMSAKLGIVSVESELGLLGSQIASLENSMQIENAKQDSCKSKLANVRATLEATPKEVEMYSEENVGREREFEDKKLELARLRQQYTEENPIILKALQHIDALKVEIERDKKTMSRQKVVFGRNPVYTSLRTEMLKLELDIAGGESALKGYEQRLAELRSRRLEMNELLPKFKSIDENIANKKSLLNRIEAKRKSLEMFLERSFSDISIYEKAIAAGGPTPTKRLIKTAGAGAATFALTIFVVLLLELKNLKIRSRADIEKALDIPMLGAIPELNSEKRAVFYSSLLGTVTNAEEKLSDTKQPVIISVAPQSQDDLNLQLQKDLLELLDVRNLRVLVLKFVSECHGDDCTHLANDFFYGLTDEMPKPSDKGELFFLLDDMAFLSPPNVARLRQTKLTHADYNIVLIDLFEHELNQQLFVEICKFSDMTVIPVRYGKTDKFELQRILVPLRESSVRNVCALMEEVNVKNYSLVI